MNNELRELYQDIILEHGRTPRHFFTMENATCCGKGHNPLCGDTITVYLNIDNKNIKEVSFQGKGCAISVASASLMSEAVQGLHISDAQQLFEKFHTLLTQEENNIVIEDLGKLAVLEGVKEFPARVKCATLAWHTLQNALSHNPDTAKTE